MPLHVVGVLKLLQVSGVSSGKKLGQVREERELTRRNRNLQMFLTPSSSNNKGEFQKRPKHFALVPDLELEVLKEIMRWELWELQELRTWALPRAIR